MVTNERFDAIRAWAQERGLYTEGDQITQVVKLGEEIGELGHGIIKSNRDEVIDAIGDSVVVMTNLCKLYGTKIEHCMTDENIAYQSSDAKVQYALILTELGKIGLAVVGRYEALFETSIGNMFQMLERMAYIHDVTIEYCVDEAYEVISKRTGSMQNGSFIKDEAVVGYKAPIDNTKIGTPTGRCFEILHSFAEDESLTNQYVIGNIYQEIYGQYAHEGVVYLKNERGYIFYVKVGYVKHVATVRIEEVTERDTFNPEA